MSIYVAKDIDGTVTLFSEKPDWVKDKDNKLKWHSDKAFLLINENLENPVFNLLPGQIIEFLAISNKRMPAKFE